MARLLTVACLLLGACQADVPGTGGGPQSMDMAVDFDLAASDLATDGATGVDLQSSDFAAGPPDFAADLALDLSSPPPDLSTTVDLAPARDLSTPDLATAPDLATTPDLAAAPDLAPARPPCTHGPGFVAFRFHYGANGTSPIIDAFGLPDGSNFQAVPAFSTSIVDPGNGGGIEIAGSNWLLIRYSVAGLSTINGATFSIFGRSYDTTASGSFEAWTPLYGSAATAPSSFSNAWPYHWSSVDFTGLVAAGDAPGLTGIRLYARGGSDDLVIHTVELCIDGY